MLALRIALREMKLSQMKNDFVSNVSHELRTPLASIRVFGEFLRLGRFGGPEKAREYGDYIETESRRLTQLVDNILDFASIESGRKTYRFERCDVREVVAATLKTFEVRLRQDGFRIHLEGADVAAAAGAHRFRRHRAVALQPARQRRQVLPRGARHRRLAPPGRRASSSSPSATRGSASRATSSGRSSTASTA